MKQIVLVSRINANDNEQEFNKYSDDSKLELLLKSAYNQYKLLIINGYLLRDLDDDYLISKKILKLANNQGFDKSQDTVIAYHNLKDFNIFINKAFLNDGWNKISIAKYSSASERDTPLYQILNPLGKALKKEESTDEEIKKLWIYLSGGILEVKLNLLHDIVEGKTTALNPQLESFETDYNDFKKQINGHYDNQNAAQRQALTTFRDVLLAKI